MCGKQCAGLNCAVKRKPGFQSPEAVRGSVQLAGTNAKCLEGSMTRKFDVIVIGTGSAASAVASHCREAGWQVAIVDSRPFGGTCALRGCDPKKVLVGAAEAVDWIHRMKGKGIHAKLQIDWPS
jgi:xanthine/CO dehydrogenase XdhC/CoxF family maturation factor